MLLGVNDGTYEREADNFADSVINGGPPVSLSAVQGGSAEERESIDSSAAGLVSRVLQSSSGQSLSPQAARPFEARLSVPASSVRLHTGTDAAAAADALGARAFTAGRDIVFGANQYAPHTREGSTLLAHEMAHVGQQSASSPATHTARPGAVLVQRQEKAPKDPARSDSQDDEPAVVEEEVAKYRWINYAHAAETNRNWFGLLRLGNINPLRPYDPFTTPNAFINRVAQWQMAVNRPQSGGPSFSQFVFAASQEQADVREGSPDTVTTGITHVAQSLRNGSFAPGLNVEADGVLGPSTLWTMMVADSMARSPANVKALKEANVPLDLLNFATTNPGAYETTWRAVHAAQFNRARFKVTWSVLVKSGEVFTTFEELNELPDSASAFLKELFFGGQLPDKPAIDDQDLIAILARGYSGDALEVLASLMEVDRTYYNEVDIERLLNLKKPDWRHALDLRMAEVRWSRAKKLVENLNLDPPETSAAKASLHHLEDQDANLSGKGPMSVLAVVAKLPEKDPQFWRDTASKYVQEKAALELAANEAFQEYVEGLNKQLAERMKGRPDIQKSDAAAFMELLVGDAFEAAQNAQRVGSRDFPGIEITQKFQPKTAGAKADELYARSKQADYLIVQLTDDEKDRFPLPLRQIEASRLAAAKNGGRPFMFDMIDTPHAAMHGYTATRFTARKTKNGSELAVNPYELVEDKDARAWEKWDYRIRHEFGTFEPVLIEINQFNPDAGALFRAGRQLFGTDKIVVQYLWTLGGSLPSLSGQLWSSQDKINVMGWVDSVLTVVAIASVVAAPMGAGAAASTSTAAAELGEAAIASAMRRALYIALRKFVINEAIAESLNRASYYIENDPDVPDTLKTAWRGLMVALLIYGGTQVLRQGIKGIKALAGAESREALAAVEAELEAGVQGGKNEVTASELAAESEIKEKTAEKFQEITGSGDGEPGAGRVRSDDPRTAGVSGKADSSFSKEDGANLRKALGDELASTLEARMDDASRKRLAQINVPEAIKKLAESFKPKDLARLLASVETTTLREFAKTLETEALAKLLKVFAGKPAGVRLMNAFAAAPERLSTLLTAFDGKNLLSLAEDPGAEVLFKLTSSVDPSILGNALKNMGRGRAGSMARFRNLFNAVGLERTAQVLNTYTPGEISARWRTNGRLTAAQNVAALAIRLDRPSVYRARLGSVPAAGGRPTQFAAKDFGTFYAVGKEATASPAVRSVLSQIQTATAKAANHLQELIGHQKIDMVTDADIKALPPNARATVEAFLEAGPKNMNRDALYGSALQYLAEGELRKAGGGALPGGLSARIPETRGGRTLIPDLQGPLDLNLPNGERVVFDWTTTGQAGKVEKYAGGQPPVKYAIEIVQPGPPPAAESAASLPMVIPRKLDDPPIDSPLPDTTHE